MGSLPPAGLLLGQRYQLDALLAEGALASTWLGRRLADAHACLLVICALPAWAEHDRPAEAADSAGALPWSTLLEGWRGARAALQHPLVPPGWEVLVDGDWCAAVTVLPAAVCPAHPELPEPELAGQRPSTQSATAGGELLTSWLRRHCAPPEQAVAWGRALCEVLIQAHALPTPLFLRDLDAATVWVTPDADLLLCAPGFAPLFERRRAGLSLVGATVRFAALRVDPRGDVYAVGSLLWQVLTGHPPPDRDQRLFAAESRPLQDLLGELCPQAPSSLAVLLEAALELEPARRPRHALALYSALGEVQAALGERRGQTQRPAACGSQSLPSPVAEEVPPRVRALPPGEDGALQGQDVQPRSPHGLEPVPSISPPTLLSGALAPSQMSAAGSQLPPAGSRSAVADRPLTYRLPALLCLLGASAGAWRLAYLLYLEEPPERALARLHVAHTRHRVRGSSQHAVDQALPLVDAAVLPATLLTSDGAIALLVPARGADAAFYLDRTEVTVAQYRRFVEARGYQAEGPWMQLARAGRDGDPVVGVTRRDAQLYAAWAGKRLPTRQEWRRAAGGEGRSWPWGERADDALAVVQPPLPSSAVGSPLRVRGGGPVGLRPAGSLPGGASPWGVLDMCGNAWEWTASPGAPSEEAEVLGGSFNTPLEQARIRALRCLRPQDWATDVGFRCAMDPP